MGAVLEDPRVTQPALCRPTQYDSSSPPVEEKLFPGVLVRMGRVYIKLYKCWLIQKFRGEAIVKFGFASRGSTVISSDAARWP